MAPAIIDWLPGSIGELPAQLVTEESFAEPDVKVEERFDVFELEGRAGRRIFAPAATRAQLKAAELGHRRASRRLRQLRRYDAFQGRVVRFGPRKTTMGVELPAGDYVLLDEAFWVASGSSVAQRPVKEVLLPPGMGLSGVQPLWGCLEFISRDQDQGQGQGRYGIAGLSGVCRQGEPRARRQGHRVWFHQGIGGGPMAVVAYPGAVQCPQGQSAIVVFRPDGRGKAFLGYVYDGGANDGVGNRFAGFEPGAVKEWGPATEADKTLLRSVGRQSLTPCGLQSGTLSRADVAGEVLWCKQSNTLFWVPIEGEESLRQSAAGGSKVTAGIRVLRDAQSEVDDLALLCSRAS